MQQPSSTAWKSRLSIPSYRIGEAASYAKVSPQTVAAWHKSQSKFAKSVLGERTKGEGLSFLQLIEVAVVAEMRRSGVKLTEIRQARDYLIEKTGFEFPFAQLKFKTDGADILGEVEGPLGETLTDRLLAFNHRGQLVWSEFLSSRLKTFNYDERGSVITWKVAGEDKDIEIDPTLAFGAPQVDGVKTSLIKTRFSIGEEVDEISEDYSITNEQVVEALLFEGLERSNPRIARWLH